MQAAAHSKEPNAPPGVTKERAVPFPFGNPTELHGRIKAQYIFGTINHLLTCKSDLAGSRPPTPQNPAKLSKPRRPPGGALPFWRALFAQFTIMERVSRSSRSRSSRRARPRPDRPKSQTTKCRSCSGVKDAGRMTRYSRRPVNTGAVDIHAGSRRLSSRIQNVSGLSQGLAGHFGEGSQTEAY
jgi:hypothetical protein